jgi:hypothetical protein
MGDVLAWGEFGRRFAIVGGLKMRDYNQKELEGSRPQIPATDAITYCLTRLYEDQEHSVSDFLAPHLTYEELIGALLVGLDAVKQLEGTEPGRPTRQ